MTTSPYATLTTQDDVSIVTLNRPERLNAIGETLLTDLHRALVAAHADAQTRARVDWCWQSFLCW